MTTGGGADTAPTPNPQSPAPSWVRLILVRHGVTAWNEAGRYQGLQDVPLGESGRHQAERIQARLRDEAITAAYSSDLCRARETAEIVLAGHPVQVVATTALREMCFGFWEGLGHEEIAQRFPEDWGRWTSAPASTCPPGSSENLEELGARMAHFFNSIVNQVRVASSAPAPDWFSYRAAGQQAEPGGGAVLLVSHGGPIRALLAHLFALPIESYWQFGIRPASVSILDIHPQGAIAEVIGDTSHLGDR